MKLSKNKRIRKKQEKKLLKEYANSLLPEFIDMKIIRALLGPQAFELMSMNVYPAEEITIK